MEKSFVMIMALVAAGIVQQGCDFITQNNDSSPIVGSWTFEDNADVKTGIIYHNSTANTSKHTDTTFNGADLSGSTTNFASDGTCTMNVPFLGSNLNLNGTWNYSAADSNLTMKVQGTVIWPDSRTGKLVVSNNTATITYNFKDTLSHGVNTFGTKSDTTSDVFVGTEVIKFRKR